MDRRTNALDFAKALGSYSTHSELMGARSRTNDPAIQAQLAPMEHRAFAREFATESPLKAAVSLPFAIPAYTASKFLGLSNARSPASLNEMVQGFAGLGEGLGAAGKNWLTQLQAYGRK